MESGLDSRGSEWNGKVEENGVDSSGEDKRREEEGKEEWSGAKRKQEPHTLYISTFQNF